MGVSKNNGTPKSSILIGFSIINHPFWGTPIFGNIHIIFAKKQRNLKQCRILLQHHQRERDSALEFDLPSLPRLTLGPWVNLGGFPRSSTLPETKPASLPLKIGLLIPQNERLVSLCHPFSGAICVLVLGRHVIIQYHSPRIFGRVLLKQSLKQGKPCRQGKLSII